ncbi:MAG: type II toxin-antitoxin system ParD family antitoxin [Pseudomonadota bacterium]
MVTHNVVLTENQAELVENLVASGRYQNASEAMCAGLRLLEREEAEIKQLRDRIGKSLKQADDGDFAEGSGEDAIRRAFAEARHRRT